jgi:hypothetical protein
MVPKQIAVREDAMRSTVCPWLMVLALATLIAGCNSSLETGKPFAFPSEKDSMLFGVTSFAESAITNQDGIPVTGVILQDASLIESPQELSEARHRRYVVFRGFMLGEGAKSRYWQQQSEKRVGLGTPDFDYTKSKVQFVDVDSNRIVISCKSLKAAHVTLSVDTNDFSRIFKP